MTIYLENISKMYKDVIALKDFSISVEDDRCYAFVGPEGSGKSTVLKIFMGILKPDSGKVSRMGDYKYPTLKSAYVSQEGVINLKQDPVWHVRKAHRTASKGRAIEELGVFFSKEEMRVKASELSEAGKRQIEIVRALFVPADFIVLDEPFRGMNREESRRAADYIMSKRDRRPLLIASREEPEIKGIRMIRMEKQ